MSKRICLTLFAGVAFVWSACSRDATAPVANSIDVIQLPGADTIDAYVSTPLIIEITSVEGKVVPNATVRLRARPASTSPYLPELYFAPAGVLTPSEFRSSGFDTTDAAGRISLQIRLGRHTPEGHLVINVGTGYGEPSDTVTLGIQPGAAVGVRVTPSDTTVYVDRTVRLDGRVVDRYDNARADPVTYEAGPSLTADNTGLVTPSAYARSRVIVHGAGGHDTALLSVVPHGLILAVPKVEGNGPFYRFELDGSGVVAVPTLKASFDAAPHWTPGDTKGFVFSTFAINIDFGAELFRSDSLGNAVRIFPLGTFRNAAYPRYSADGTWIYFSGQKQDLMFHLWRVHPDGTGAEDLGTNLGGAGVDWRSDPSPDGTRLVFTTQTSGVWSVRTLDLATHQVSSWSIPGQTARWSPAGDRLAVMPNVIVNADGTGSHAVTSSSNEGDWSPDSQWLIFSDNFVLKVLQVDTGLLLPLAWSNGLTHPTWKR